MESLIMMIYSFIFILLNISSSLPAKFSVIGPDLPLVIPPGEDAVLPCHLSPQINAENMTIRWFKGKYQDLVHLYKDREDQYENQMAEYRSRTTLIKDGVTAGSVSLIIHNVRSSDSGSYTCFYDVGFFYEEAVVELKVAALGLKLHIYLDDLQDGGILVVCESSGWYPEPEAQWRDDNGNNISSSTKVKAMDGSLQFRIKTTYFFNSNPTTLSCCVRNAVLNQWKQTTIHITDGFFQRISSCVLNRLLVSVPITVLGILSISLAAYLLTKKELENRGEVEKLEEELGKLPVELEWRRSRHFAADVTLDPDTAHRELILSEDRRSVRYGDRAQDLPDTPQRFTQYSVVLGRERLSSGRHYWEVEVGDKTKWQLGVCRESVDSKGQIYLSPVNGYWTVWLRDGKYEARTSPPTTLTPRVAPRAVGLFLDYEAGRLSVYNVDDRSLLFTFSGASFLHPIQPYFNPCVNDEGRNPGALRILPVKGRE